MPDMMKQRSGDARAEELWSELKRSVSEEERISKDSVSPDTPAALYRSRELCLQFYEMYPHDFRSAHLRSALLNGASAEAIRMAVAAVSNNLAWASKGSQGGWGDKDTLTNLWDMDAQVRKIMSLDQASKFGEARHEFRWMRIGMDDLHLDEARERAIYASLEGVGDKKLRELITGSERLLDLKRNPLKLSLPTLDGLGTVDLQRLRGKVVMVEMWSLACSSCIAAMPKLQYLNDAYKDRGFEIFGIFVDLAGGANSRAKALQIVDQQGAEWPQAVLADKKARELLERYAVLGMPTVWLLDGNGLLVTQLNGNYDFLATRAGKSFAEKTIIELLDSNQARR